MVDTVKDSEYLVARKTAEEYRKRGYEVTLEAPLDFMPGIRADLLVRKGEETKVIEVRTRGSLGADPRTAELARLVESKPGWSFELVLVGEPEKVESPLGARSFETRSIAKRIEEAERSLATGLPEAAFLLAWSALEAAARDSLSSRGFSDSRITSPGFILDQAVYQGLFSREDYNALTRMLRYRNAIVHGFNADDFSDEMVKTLIDIISRIDPDESSNGDAENASNS